MNITMFLALSNQNTKTSRCIPPDDDPGAAMTKVFGISSQTNSQILSVDDHLVIDAGGRHKAIMNRPLLDSEAVAPVSKLHTAESA